MSNGPAPRAPLTAPPRVVNVGLPLFAEEPARLGMPVTHVDWSLPAGESNVAASELLARALMPDLARAGARHGAAGRVAEFIADNDQSFRNLAMAAGKAIADAAAGVEASTLVSTPAGLCFPGFGPQDANPDMGDSAIGETIGLGGGAMAASPAVARFVGASWLAEALAATAEIREICYGEHPYFHIPTLDEQGPPVGLDVRPLVETGITPLINTGIAGRRAGTGQVGAGVVRAPRACFAAALGAAARPAPPVGQR